MPTPQEPRTTPTKILFAYFRLRHQLSASQALRPERRIASTAPCASALERLGELAWYAQDLSPQQVAVLELRMIGAGGSQTNRRYAGIAEMASDETPTGALCPQNPNLLEVESRYTSAPTLAKVAEQLGITRKVAMQAESAARRMVRRRMESLCASRRKPTIADPR